MKISAGIVIRYNNKILFCSPPNTTKNFGPPKGGQEIGETLVETALRETLEEVGILIDINNEFLTKKPITVTYMNKGGLLYKTVYLFIYDINSLSDIGLENEVVPIEQLQLTEVSWAGFLSKSEVEPVIFHRFKELLNML